MNHFISKMGIPGISLVGLLAVALVGIGAFGSIWGTVQGQEDETMRDELAEARRQLIEDSSRGYVSKGGNTGRVTSIDSASGRVAIDTPKGETMVTIGDQTVIREYGSGNQMTSGDLANSKLVVIGSERTSNGDVALLEVVPEGDDGYKISPASDDGPAMVPVFP